MNRGIYGLGSQAVNGTDGNALAGPGQSIGVFARVVPWLGNQDSSTSTSIAFSTRQYIIIGNDPVPAGNNGSNQFTGLALQLPSNSSAFILTPATTDSNSNALGQGIAAGAARGQAAIDLQVFRTSSAQVASGTRAIAIGQSNTSSSNDSSAIGNGNTASGIFSVAIGYTNSASGSRNAALGYANSVGGTSDNVGMGRSNTVTGQRNVGIGYGNTASGSNNSMAFGDACTTSAIDSACFGQNCTADQTTAIAIGHFAGTPFSYSVNLNAGRFPLASAGGSQTTFAFQRYITTTNATTELYGDGNTGTARLVVTTNTSYAWKLQLVARQTGGAAGTAGDTAIWHFEGGVYRGAGNVALLGAVQTSYMAVAAASTWTATIGVDPVTNQHLYVLVSGENSKNINWVATWQMTRNA